MWDVLGFGVVAVDDIVYVDAYPPSDSKAPVVAEKRDGGGLAGTALVAAARLGARTAYGGILGDDDLSRFTLAEFEREGVDCSLVVRQPGARPVHSIIIVDRSNGHRTILYSGVMTPPPLQDVAQAIAQSRVLFVDSTIAAWALDALRLAHEHGVAVVADLERRPGQVVSDLGAAVDHLILGSAFASQMTGKSEPADMVRSLRTPAHAACVVTTGGDGCWYATRASDEIRHLPAFKVQAVDTTGCGDVFHGAYAASIARGEPIERALTVATATAGLKATRPGGRNGIPDRAEVEQFLRQHGR